ncbi:MAG: signal peptide peptidase SppA [Candidatus Zixiibacteriota bacterium]|nr:MAG: signal peptide peptidase SppA [candidate division Zixibacteria bacterium]
MIKQSRLIPFLIVLLFCGGSFTAAEAGERIVLPQGVFYYQPAASVFGSEATWINPAGLARYRIAGFQFMADYFDGKYAKNWGTVINREGLAISYRNIYNPNDENYVDYILAVGLPAGKRLSLGASHQYFKQGEGIFDNRHFWNVGLVLRPEGAFSFGAVFSNLNRGKVNDERTETEMRYSLSYRPQEYDLTVSVDMFLSTGTRLSNADYVYHAEFSPIKGLYVNGLIDSDKNLQIGVRANLRQYFVGARHRSDKDGNHRGTTAFVGATSKRQPSLVKDKVRRLSLGLSGRPSENPPDPVFGKHPTSFVRTLLEIYRAADDRSIGEMVVTLNRLGLGFARAQELREALQYFRSKGKTVICHISYPNNLAYYVGSACDSILIPPVSQLNLVGLRAELTFYAGTMEKLGIKADLMRIGKYKTAAEQYTRETATEENRRQVNRLLDDLFEQFVDGIARGRGVSIDSAAAIVDGGPYTSKEALELGLVDGLSYKDELKDNYLRGMPEITMRRYFADTVVQDCWREKPTLAIVVAEGDVAFDGGGIGPFAEPSDVTPGRMSRAFDRAGTEKSVNAVIFRINSPGGLALAGEEIYHAAMKASRKKPVVVSMANVAASGGYYIAMPASHIWADPATITGSIGIYGGKADLSGLYEKINLGKELYTRGRFAGMLTTMRPFTDEEREKYYSQMEAMYGHFVSLVSDNRQLTVDSVQSLAQGKVWTGREALDNGLVDRLGGLKEALDFTAKELGLDDYRVEILPRKRPLFILPGNRMLKSLAGFLGLGTGVQVDETSVSDHVVTDGILARLPFDIEIE